MGVPRVHAGSAGGHSSPLRLTPGGRSHHLRAPLFHNLKTFVLPTGIEWTAPTIPFLAICAKSYVALSQRAACGHLGCNQITFSLVLQNLGSLKWRGWETHTSIG